MNNRELNLGKSTLCSLHALVARNEALEWGHFRGEGPEIHFSPDVALGERGRFTPLPAEAGAIRLNEVFAGGIRYSRMADFYTTGIKYFSLGDSDPMKQTNHDAHSTGHEYRGAAVD